MPNDPFATRHGWTLFRYPAFRTPYDTLVTEVGKLAAANPEGLATHPKTKLLKRINDLILDESRRIRQIRFFGRARLSARNIRIGFAPNFSAVSACSIDTTQRQS